MPLAPPDAQASDALELLAWMIGHGHLDVKVAVPCDADGRPLNDTAIFHEKSGVIEDRAGYKIAWTGSLNETAAGWRRNWESINVYRSWGPEPERVAGEERNFARLWANRSPARRRARCARRRPTGPAAVPATGSTRTPEGEDAAACSAGHSPRARPRPSRPCCHRPTGADSSGRSSSARRRWPRAERKSERPRRPSHPGRISSEPSSASTRRGRRSSLIADEVGLGKTIQAGLLLRQAWLAGRAKRILILVPKAVLKQWQIELREKFNLNWPIYDGRKLSRYPARALRGHHEREVDPRRWHEETRRDRVQPPDAPKGPRHRAARRCPSRGT